jgi:hypothetical protein
MKKWVLLLVGLIVVLGVVSLYYFIIMYIYPTGFYTSPTPPYAVLMGIYVPSTAKVGEEISISLTIKNNEDVDITCQSNINPHYDIPNGEVVIPSILLEPLEVKNIAHSIVFSESGVFSGEIRIFCSTDILDYDPRLAGSPYIKKSGSVHVSSDLSLPSNVNVITEPSYHLGKENLLTIIEFDVNVNE